MGAGCIFLTVGEGASRPHAVGRAGSVLSVFLRQSSIRLLVLGVCSVRIMTAVLTRTYGIDR